VNVVGELQRKRTLAASRGFLAAARLSCFEIVNSYNVAYDRFSIFFLRHILWKICNSGYQYCSTNFIYLKVIKHLLTL